MHQPVAIYNKPFDEGYEVRGVFLDILKGFDKVWPSGILFKLKQIVISENLLELKIPN